jgi:hypothetical protein
MTYDRLVDKCGGHEQTTGRIVSGDAWRHLPGCLGRTKTSRLGLAVLVAGPASGPVAVSVISSARTALRDEIQELGHA